MPLPDDHVEEMYNLRRQAEVASERRAVLLTIAGPNCETFNPGNGGRFPAGYCLGQGRYLIAGEGATQACWPCMIHTILGGDR